jgi:Cof subfamily protein (haloacid dehalogenase superfamily)
MRNAYDLIAIDVDGTLITSDHQISPRAAEAIALASSRELLPVLVSGRSFLLLDKYIKALAVAPYYIGSGGAIVATVDGTIIAYNPVSLADATTVAHVARSANLGICFHEATQQNCEMPDPELRAHLRIIARSDIDFVEDILDSTTEAPEKITVFGDRDELEKTKAHLSQLNLNISMTFSGPRYLEVTRGGVSKGMALESLAAYLKIPLNRVAAVGDQQNDISMFQVAGLSVAMGNAPDEVKSVADHVAPTNDEGGLAWTLRELVLRYEEPTP